MKNTKLGSVQIYYGAYNKAAVLEKKLTTVLKSDATDHHYDFKTITTPRNIHTCHLTTIKSVSNAIHRAGDLGRERRY